MTKRGTLISAFCAIFLSPLHVLSGPTEPLSDIIASSPVIFVGKFQSTRKTDKTMMKNYMTFNFHVTKLKVDTLLKGPGRLKTLDVVDVPASEAGVDTSRNMRYLYFISGSSLTVDSADLMVERQYKITNGKITPFEVLEEDHEQPVSVFLAKIRKIVREQKKK
jgi:hypothetical protein